MFVGGYGRSGSTIIDLLLNRIDDIRPVGEFRHLFGRAWGDNELCSCGDPFQECDSWDRVLDKAFPDGVDRVEMDRTMRMTNRITSVPMIRHPPLRTPEFRRRIHAYREAFTAAYQAVAEVSGVTTIVDSSKYPLHALLMSDAPAIDQAVMLLVRDPRAVAHSWQRKRIRPEVHWEKREMPRHHVVRSAVAWNLSNRLTELLRGTKEYRLQRYEDFVRSPRKALDQIASFATGEDVRVDDTVFGEDHEEVHTIAGNPVRLKGHSIEVRSDDEWRREMRRYEQLLVSCVCAPQMWRYGYPLLPRS